LGYPDGSVQPEGDITREEVAAIFFRLLTTETRNKYRKSTTGFPDVPDEMWSAESIGTMENIGVLNGYPDGTFMPEAVITRAEFATIVVRFDQLVPGARHAFSDITDQWAEASIATAASIGWVNGYPDGTFAPEQAITRAETMTLINRVLERHTDAEGILPSIEIDWPDVEKDYWAYYEIQEATVSHLYDRRIEGEVTENWTGLGKDVNFDIE
jgi:hypothetical protein